MREKTVYPVDMVAHLWRTRRKTMPGTPGIISTSAGTQSIATVPISPSAPRGKQARGIRGSAYDP